MSYKITNIDAMRLFDVAYKLISNKISLNDGEMIAYRNLYKQLDTTTRRFIQDKYGETLDFLENYEGVKKNEDQLSQKVIPL